ncbi:MAG: TIGR00282 family metallophosphoesterase [Firmicutes bacterium]|nr:TIGR00282 family metallophosphoesterase [Bacillota bacterium]MCL5038883.1 TIGR00282 family metallophosphoesterase [Bacillota bacterium]
MRILAIGDIVGKPGRQITAQILPSLLREEGIDFVLANGENAAGGTGITREVADDLFSLGIDVLTMGNHVWDKKEIFEFIGEEKRLVRPLNYPPGAPGRGSVILRGPGFTNIAVVNAAGRVFNPVNLDCPFRTLEKEVEALRQQTPLVLVDFHAEATSEKMALAWYLDGKVTALLGTHTHVQTSDERVLPGGTAFITDVGMTGPYNSVIGVGKKEVIERFLTQLPARFDVAKGPSQFSAVLLDVDETTGRSRGITRIFLRLT